MQQTDYDLELMQQRAADLFARYRADWNFFAQDVFGVTLDAEQRAILHAFQTQKRVSVRSGTARGKDFVSAVAALCFLYLTPRWSADGQLLENTKVALTAPTERQVKNIMMPEISRLFVNAKRRGRALPGKLLEMEIRTDNKEWFLVGFKADNNNHEAWSGFHASNVAFIVTEATGISEDTFNAIEGNLQGNSRIMIVFNPNITTGYAALSQTQERWARFSLNDLNAPNVLAKRVILPGQVDYEWVADHVAKWCETIPEADVRESENDFLWEGKYYRPNDLFRIKVLGEFPKVGDDQLIPAKWIEIAQQRWKSGGSADAKAGVIIGADVAGMGRDDSVDCYRVGAYVEKFEKHNSAGRADHMATAGRHVQFLEQNKKACVSIDTIGEGAGVFSREMEIAESGKLDDEQIISCKFSEAARNKRTKRELTDVTGEYYFANMKAYLYWAVRDWLNPDNNTGAALPPGGSLMEEATAVKWQFRSDGKILIEPKEKTKERLGHSPDELDALANTFHPLAVEYVTTPGNDELTDDDLAKMFF